MVKPGDIVEWRGASKTFRGRVELFTFDSRREYLVRLEDGRTFRLRDISRAKSFRVL